LTEKSEQATTELQEEVEAAQEEKDTIVKQLKQSETSINNFENEVARLAEELSVRLENNSSLDKQFNVQLKRDGNKSLYLVFVRVVFLSILNCFYSS
jgi:septal ring factor EnvC (AmiA/AmiB activator)